MSTPSVDWLDPARDSCLIDGVRYTRAPSDPNIIDGLIPRIRVTDQRRDGFIREIEIGGVRFRREGLTIDSAPEDISVIVNGEHYVLDADRRAEQEAGWKDAWIHVDDLRQAAINEPLDHPRVVRIRIPDSTEET